MEKSCTHCNIENNIEDFYKKYTERKNRNRERSLKRYNEKKEKISKQLKMYYEKNRY